MVSNLGIQPVVNSESESQQTFHRWMKRCQAATVGLIVGIFVMALWTSINWKQVAPFEVAFWWMAFALSGIPLTIFVGLDIIYSRGAVIPMQWGAGPKQMVTVTGRKAVLTGLGVIAVALAWGGFVLALMVSDADLLLGSAACDDQCLRCAARCGDCAQDLLLAGAGFLSRGGKVTALTQVAARTQVTDDEAAG